MTVNNSVLLFRFTEESTKRPVSTYKDADDSSSDWNGDLDYYEDVSNTYWDDFADLNEDYPNTESGEKVI